MMETIISGYLIFWTNIALLAMLLVDTQYHCPMMAVSIQLTNDH